MKIRGLPLHAWAEDNVKLISKKVGRCGWCINRPNTLRCLEIPRICCYTSSHNRINKGDFVRVEKAGYHLKHDFFKGYCVLKEESRNCSNDPKCEMDKMEKEERMKVEVEDIDVVKLGVEDKNDDFHSFLEIILLLNLRNVLNHIFLKIRSDKKM